MHLFVDLDGVLADFDSHYENLFGIRPDKKVDNVNWDLIRDHKDFFLGIPPMHDMQELWGHVSQYNPTILTGIPKSIKEVESNKRNWVKNYLGDDVSIICCQSYRKSEFANPGDILIDDWEKYKNRWVAMGGVWITHNSASESIVKLNNIMGKNNV